MNGSRSPEVQHCLLLPCVGNAVSVYPKHRKGRCTVHYGSYWISQHMLNAAQDCQQPSFCIVHAKANGHWPSGATLLGVANDHVAQARAHVCQVCGQSQHCHDLRCHSNVKAGLPGHAFLCGGLPNSDLTQESVIHIHHSLPCDSAGLNV